MKCYLANGLFTIGDRMVNEIIASKVREAISDIDLFSPMEQPFNDKESFADSITIAKV
jgi:hypothetical protein